MSVVAVDIHRNIEGNMKKFEIKLAAEKGYGSFYINGKFCGKFTNEDFVELKKEIKKFKNGLYDLQCTEDEIELKLRQLQEEKRVIQVVRESDGCCTRIVAYRLVGDSQVDAEIVSEEWNYGRV